MIPYLIEAAKAAGLKEPFAHVTELGDYAISYRVAGFLADVKQLLSARSRLRISVLDTLHSAGIEVASPTLIDQRRIPEGSTILPHVRAPKPKPASEPAIPAEAILFDKADRAADMARQKAELETLSAEIADVERQSGKSGLPEQRQTIAKLQRLRARSRELDEMITAALAEADD